MAAQFGNSTNKASLFDGNNYAFWRKRMKYYLMAQGYEIWQIIEDGFIPTKTPPIDKSDKRLYVNNAKAMNTILSGLRETKFLKVMQCKSAKEIWDKLKSTYEGDDKVRRAKF